MKELMQIQPVLRTAEKTGESALEKARLTRLLLARVSVVFNSHMIPVFG